MATRVINPALELMPREQLDRLVEGRLVAQIRRAYERIPFYRKRWPAAAAGIGSVDEFRRRIPFTTKKDLLDETEAADRLGVPPEQLYQFHLTSGTSGLGQEVHALTYSDYEALGSTWIYQTYWAGLDPGDRMAYTFQVGLQTGGLQSQSVAERTGILVMQLGPYPTEAKIDYLLKFQPQAFVATPAYLTRITTGFEERGLEPRDAMHSLKVIFIAAESYTLEWAIRMQVRWGCHLSEWYGTMQGGLNAAVSCEAGVVHDGARGGLHLMEHRIFFEILGPDGDEPVQPGEEGELVKTTLFREAFPVVRFRTGDRVRMMPGPCACGRPFAMIEAGTISRFDDMFKVRGQNVWPESVDAVLFADERIDEYMGTVSVDDRGQEHVEVKFELRPTVALSESDLAELIAGLERGLKRRTGVNMAVERVPPGTVPRFQFKVRRWTDTRRKDRAVVRYTTD